MGAARAHLVDAAMVPASMHPAGLALPCMILGEHGGTKMHLLHARRRLLMTGVRFSRRTAAVWTVLVCATCPVVSVADHQSVPVEPLAAFAKLDPADITVSGISSGAFFAHQFHIAFSSLVKGAGIVAGGPFGCAAQVDNITPPFGNPFVLTLVPRRVVASLAVCTHFGRSDFEQAGWHSQTRPRPPACKGRPFVHTQRG